jgi:SAM-dependent methyltransferase
VANVGAGAGSYEPAQTIVALEPSRVMIRQRPASAAPAVQAAAEALPLRTGVVDAALAVLTVHHWTDPAAGVAEMRRVACRRVIILTWDHEFIRDFWLLRDYVPAATETDDGLAHRSGLRRPTCKRRMQSSTDGGRIPRSRQPGGK